jgi:lipoprotein NlpD
MGPYGKRLLAVLLVAGLLQACAGALRWSPETYVVEEGDTLYSIAFRHGVDYRALARWNNIGSNYLIFPGDELVLSPPPSARRGPTRSSRSSNREQGNADRTADTGSGSETGSGNSPGERESPESADRGDIQWAWPLEGEVVGGFGEGSMPKGIQIAANEGEDVIAASSGRVVYTGSGLIGYGKLIIIKHNDVYLSAYGHNKSILVSEGDEVEAGEPIAHVGLGRGNQPMLHFEIRREGRAVDPTGFLP